MSRALWKAAAGACLALAGCAVAPKYHPPAAQAPLAYKEPPPANGQWKTANPSDGQVRGDWWEVFGDPQLNRLETMVSVSNESLKQAQAQFRQARALVAGNRANYFPSFGAQPALTASEQSTNLGSHRLGGTGLFTLFTLPLGVSWEPDFWGRVTMSVQNAVAGAQATAADVENARLSLQAELASDYFQIEGLDMEQRLLQDNLTAYEKALQLTINRHNGGVASRADVVQAETQLASTRAQLTDLGVARAQMEHAIAVLTGRPPADFSLPPGEIHGPPPELPTGVPSQLLERRPDIAAAERRVAAANEQIGLAKVAYYPSVALGGSGGAQSGSILNWLSWPSRFFSIGPSVAETLLDFGRRRAQVQQAEASYDATVAAYRQTVLGAFQEVEDNLAALRLLEQEAAQQDAAVQAAEESVRLETERYKAGTVSYLDVITTQTIALNNERTAVGILQRRMTASVELIRALGGGWSASSLPTSQSLRSSR